MSSIPYFSICIPLYNHERYIGQTIQSVLAQDFEDFEVVVADNASTDKSREVVRSFEDSRIRLIENRYNIGFAPNLQQVTRHAQGRFINLLSSDDLMNAGALRTYATLINRHQEQSDQLVLMSQAWDINGTGERQGYVTRDDAFGPRRTQMPTTVQIEAQPLYETYQGSDVLAAAMGRLNTAGIFCTVTYSRALWEAVEGYNSTQLINPDMHFMLKLLRQNPLVVFANRPLYSYRKHEMGQNAQQERAKVLKFQVDQYKYLMEFNSDWLQGTGITEDYQRGLFVRRDCLKQAVNALARGQWLYASRLLAFAWSAYPGVTARQWQSWALGLLLATGPIGMGIARLLRVLLKQELPVFEEAARQE